MCKERNSSVFQMGSKLEKIPLLAFEHSSEKYEVLCLSLVCWIWVSFLHSGAIEEIIEYLCLWRQFFILYVIVNLVLQANLLQSCTNNLKQ